MPASVAALAPSTAPPSGAGQRDHEHGDGDYGPRASWPGSTTAEIAAELFMSVATVKAHITHILTKLDLSNRTQIALLAHDAGLA
jgi:hypothetical protein